MSNYKEREQREAESYVECIRDELRSYYNGDETDDDGEQAGLYDYLVKNELDVEYILDSSFEVVGVKVYVTLNGPTVWIDTRDQVVRYSYGGDGKAWCYIDSDIAEEITEYYAEAVRCRMVA